MEDMEAAATEAANRERKTTLREEENLNMESPTIFNIYCRDPFKVPSAQRRKQFLQISSLKENKGN
ncbi:hypothetical protein [Oceanobacter kriegii]|uniref:hypothetical protein n=1 Tax=Oceanobacter kriegii TaxID=64972 RepID=UPI00146C8426|nr:hypothetical protein [Oceanobacter kriegii]